MAWVRIHDGATRHQKLSGLSDKAFRMWIEGLSHAQEGLTDGFIVGRSLRSFVVRATAKATTELVDAGLWCRQDNGYQIHDYLDWNDSKAEITKKRDDARGRVRLHRLKRVTNSEGNAHPPNGYGLGSGSYKEPERTDSPPTSGVGRFLEWYRREAYPTYRNGAVYAGSEHLDYAAAKQLCASFSREDLHQIATTFLQIPDERESFLRGKTRTVPMLRSMASGIHERLLKRAT